MQSDNNMRKMRMAAAVAVFRFEKETPQSPDSVYAFVEGDEDPFFYTNFLHRFSDNIYSFPCGGKGGVYEAREKMANRGEYLGKALFFVDKDLSDIIPEKSYGQAVNVYTTDYYSIENELVSEGMLSKIWAELLHFRGERPDFNSVHQENFVEELQRFYDLALPIMAWLVYMRRNKRQPDLTGFHFSKLFAWDDEYKLQYHEDVQQIGLLKFLEQVCEVKEIPSSWSPDVEVMLNEVAVLVPKAYAEIMLNELAVLVPKAYIHGKLELCFFVGFVHGLINFLNTDMRDAGNKIRMKLSLGYGNAVKHLSRYADIPQSLEKFLRENLKASA
jgi:Protein of unknown function (DUF4435)